MLRWIGIVSFALLGATGAAQAAGGSYQSSCDNIRQRGPYLTAECQTVDGDSHRTSIDVRRCPGDVENRNGRLACGRGGDYGNSDGYRHGGRGYGYGEPRQRFFRAPDRYQDDDS